jgi:hypothetical protein
MAARLTHQKCDAAVMLQNRRKLSKQILDKGSICSKAQTACMQASTRQICARRAFALHQPDDTGLGQRAGEICDMNPSACLAPAAAKARRLAQNRNKSRSSDRL